MVVVFLNDGDNLVIRIIRGEELCKDIETKEF